MDLNQNPLFWAHLRSIRSAIAALVLAALALPFLLEGEELGLILGISSLVVLAYSFVTVQETKYRLRRR